MWKCPARTPSPSGVEPLFLFPGLNRSSFTDVDATSSALRPSLVFPG
jgi:hypothetical protein